MVFLKGHYLVYCTGIIGMIILHASASLVESYLLKLLLDLGTPESMMLIVKLIGLVVVYMIVIILLLPVFTFMFNGKAKLGHREVNKAIYEKYYKLPVNYYENNQSGEALSLIENDSWVVSSIFMRHFRRTITSIVTIIVYLIPMFIFDYRITSIILVLNICTLLVNGALSKKMKKLTKEIQSEMGQMTVNITNIIGGMSVIRMYQLGKEMQQSFKEHNHEVSRLQLESSKVTSKLAAYNFFISMLNTMVFLGLGSFMVYLGLTTYGNILGIMSLQTALDANFREFGQYFPLFYNSLAGTERVYEFLELPEEPEKRVAEPIESPAYIEFKNVDFGYNPEHLVLKKFNLTIQQGETLAIIGESGSGKSSIAKLLLGFYDIQSGGIAVGGKNLSEMTLDELRSLVAYVPQEATLFNTTIMENIRYGREDATDEEVIQAAKLANADDFIMQQPEGYQTVVGESGTRMISRNFE